MITNGYLFYGEERTKVNVGQLYTVTRNVEKTWGIWGGGNYEPARVEGILIIDKSTAPTDLMEMFSDYSIIHSFRFRLFFNTFCEISIQAFTTGEDEVTCKFVVTNDELSLNEIIFSGNDIVVEQLPLNSLPTYVPKPFMKDSLTDILAVCWRERNFAILHENALKNNNIIEAMKYLLSNKEFTLEVIEILPAERVNWLLIGRNLSEVKKVFQCFIQGSIDHHDLINKCHLYLDDQNFSVYDNSKHFFAYNNINFPLVDRQFNYNCLADFIV